MSTFLEIVGVIAIFVGLALVNPFLIITAVGAFLLAIGIALETRQDGEG